MQCCSERSGRHPARPWPTQCVEEWWLQAELMDVKEFGTWAKSLSGTQIKNYHSNADKVSAAAEQIKKEVAMLRDHEALRRRRTHTS